MRRTVQFLLPIAFLVAIASLGATGSSGSGSIAISSGAPVVQNFDALSSTTSPSTSLPAGWYLTESGTGAAADGAYVVGAGSSNGGGAYSFGASGSAERALGSVGSGTVTPIVYGAKFTNAGAGPITSLAVSYNGEMWRRGQSAANFDRLTFSYSVDATDLNTGTFTPIPALDFASPGNGCLGSAGQTDGNSAACRSAISSVISGLTVNPGTAIWIRWTDADTTGSDDGLAVDNVSVTATFSTAPTPPLAFGSISPNPANPGQSITLSGSIIKGFNPLSQTVTISCDLSGIGGGSATVLPNNGVSFSYNTTVSNGASLGPTVLPCSVTDDRSRSTSFNLNVTVLLPLDSACGHQATPISAVQGAGLLSPFVGIVVDVEGVVVGDFQRPGGLSGFYLEAPNAEQDANPATSEGVFVFSSTPVDIGDRVRVRGTVAEFSSATGTLVSRLTELGNVTSAQVCGSGNALPDPIDVTLPVADMAQWERVEGMLVRFRQQLVVTGNFALGQFGQLDLAPSVLQQPTQQLGSQASWQAAADLNARSIIALDDGSTQSGVNLNGGTVAPYPPPGLSNSNTLRVGASVNPHDGGEPSPLIGILDDRFGAYRLQPTSEVTFSNATNPREDTAGVAAAAGARFRIVSANVLNFFVTLGSRGAATAEELDHQRAKIISELRASGGDVIGLSELQNFANGQTNGGTYTNAAIADLASALAVATGRDYRFIDTINGANLALPNVVSDNGTDAIRSGIIYDAGSVKPVGRAALYYQNDQNRPSLAQTFQPAGGIHPERQSFTVVVNHFRSKGSPCGGASDDPSQGNCNGMRLSMAVNVAGWLGGNPTSDPAGSDRRYILVGDYNAYFGEDPIQAFLNNGFTNLIDRLIGSTAYSYNFGSQVGYLDHGLVNAAGLPLVRAVAELHINADEPPALQALNSAGKSAAANAAYYAPNEFAASDHDPFVIGFNPLLGDFTDDGVLDADDRTALLLAIARGEGDRSEPGSHGHPVDRRMDMNQDGVLTQADFLIWQRVFIEWQQKRK